MKISRPIVFLYLQTTGGNVALDRIIQIACVKIDLDGEKHERNVLVNPTIPIPEKASAVHGITDDLVKDEPKFFDYAKSMLVFFQDCDFAGYNSDTHLPFLIEEFARCKIEFPTWEPALVDVLKYDKVLYPQSFHTLYKKYTQQELQKPVNALTYANATIEILLTQLAQNEEMMPADIDLACQGKNRRFDFSGKSYIDGDGVVRWGFGTHMNEPVLNTPKSYIDYIYDSPFPYELKLKIHKLITDNNQTL